MEYGDDSGEGCSGPQSPFSLTGNAYADLLTAGNVDPFVAGAYYLTAAWMRDGEGGVLEKFLAPTPAEQEEFGITTTPEPATWLYRRRELHVESVQVVGRSFGSAAELLLGRKSTNPDCEF